MNTVLTVLDLCVSPVVSSVAEQFVRRTGYERCYGFVAAASAKSQAEMINERIVVEPGALLEYCACEIAGTITICLPPAYTKGRWKILKALITNRLPVQRAVSIVGNHFAEGAEIKIVKGSVRH